MSALVAVPPFQELLRLMKGLFWCCPCCEKHVPFYVKGKVTIFGLNDQTILRSVGICMVYLRDLFKANVKT